MANSKNGEDVRGRVGGRRRREGGRGIMRERREEEEVKNKW